jgi:hypothetical protein
MGVAGEHFVAQRKAIEGHHKRDAHLLAVGAMIARIAALRLRVRFGLALKVGARDVVQQHLVLDREQLPAALRQMRFTLGADKRYDAASFVADMRALNVTPHIAQNVSGRRSAIDARTTRHPGYAVSQKKRKRIEEPFGWGKTIGGLSRPMLRGVEKLSFKFTLTMASYNLIRLPKLIEAAA